MENNDEEFITPVRAKEEGLKTEMTKTPISDGGKMDLFTQNLVVSDYHDSSFDIKQ